MHLVGRKGKELKMEKEWDGKGKEEGDSEKVPRFVDAK